MKNFDIRRFGIVAGVIAIISIASFGVYSLLHSDKGSEIDKPIITPTPTAKLKGDESEKYEFGSIYPLTLNENEVFINMDVSDVSLKLDNEVLYVNGEAVPNIKADTAYISHQVIIFTYKGECGDYISYVLDNKGNAINFTKTDYQYENFALEGAVCMVDGIKDCNCQKNSTTCTRAEKLMVVYNGEELIITSSQNT